MLHRLAMLLQLTVGTQRSLRRLLRLTRRVLERLDSPVELFELLAVLVERLEALGDLVEPRRYAGGAIGHLLERFAERRKLGAAGGQRRQHRADGAAFLAGRGDQQLEFIGLFLNELALAP